jgi:hypothetical protein
MDRVTNSTAPADGLCCAVELSKNTWLLGIEFPDHRGRRLLALQQSVSYLGQGRRHASSRPTEDWRTSSSYHCSGPSLFTASTINLGSLN